MPFSFRPDALIFDLDGTLWDVLPTVALARNRVLDRFQIPGRRFTGPEIAPTVGLPVDEAYRRAFPDMEETLRSRVQAAVNVELQALLPVQGAHLYEGVREGLDALRSHYKLLIVSNCNTGYIESFLRWSEFDCFLDHECFGVTRQPKSANIRSVVERNVLKTPVYIGDTATDQSSAQEAGVPFIHVTWGFGTAAGPCPQFSTFPDLTRALVSLAR